MIVNFFVLDKYMIRTYDTNSLTSGCIDRPD